MNGATKKNGNICYCFKVVNMSKNYHGDQQKII